MAKEFLTQDEVDALLKGVSGEAEPEAPADAPDEGGVRPYNLATQERIVRGRMPALEIVNERFARLLRVGLYNFMRRGTEISVGPVRAQKYSEFVRNLTVPSSLNVVQVRPLRGNGLFVLDPNLVFLLVENLFGGDGRFQAQAEGREFTQTELRIVQKLLGVVYEAYEHAWASTHAIKVEHVRSEMHAQFAGIATPNEVVVSTTFTVEIGAVGGDFHVCLPYAMIEPIRETLYSSLHGERVEADKRWVHLLSRQVQSVDVELVANLGAATLSLRQVNGLKVGDVIALDIPPELTAEIDGVPVMECHYGVFNGQYALRVQRMINQGAGERFTGHEDA